jgi:hypothetical protein
MKTWKTIAAAVALFAIGAFVYAPLGSAAEGKNLEHRITEAKTLADHEAVATYYEKEAQDARRKQTEHQQMRDEYATLPVLKTKTGAVAHCDAIAKKYEEIAKEYEALAQMHREMATAAK